VRFTAEPRSSNQLVWLSVALAVIDYRRVLCWLVLSHFLGSRAWEEEREGPFPKLARSSVLLAEVRASSFSRLSLKRDGLYLGSSEGATNSDQPGPRSPSLLRDTPGLPRPTPLRVGGIMRTRDAEGAVLQRFPNLSWGGGRILRSSGFG
jgi:hypothetical protein